MKSIISLIVVVFCAGIFCFILGGCTSYKPVYGPPQCQNPFHSHYKAPPLRLWRERITTDTYTHTVEERFWKP